MDSCLETVSVAHFCTEVSLAYISHMCVLDVSTVLKWYTAFCDTFTSVTQWEACPGQIGVTVKAAREKTETLNITLML